MSTTSLAFLLFFFVALISIFAVDLIWAFYLYQSIYFLNPGSRWWSSGIPDLKYSFVAAFLLISIFVIKSKQYKQTKLSEWPQFKWLILTLIIYCFMFIVAIDFNAHKRAFIEICKLFLIITVAYKIIDNYKKLFLSIWFYILGCAYIGLEAFSAGRNSMGRVEGIGTIDAPDSNLISAAIVPAIPILLHFFWRGSNKIKFFSVLCGAYIANGLVLINSRGAFLGALAGLFFYSLSSLTFSHRENKRFRFVLIILLGLVGAVVVTDEVFWERMSTLNEVEDESKSGSHRYRMWLNTFDMLDDYPLGVGAGGYLVLSPQYVDQELFHEGQQQKAVHSTWFQCLSEVGWQGLIIFVCLLLSCFTMAQKTKKNLVSKDDLEGFFLIVALQAALLSFLVSGTFINRYRAEVLYWLILFISCAVNLYKIKYPQLSLKKRA